jgi:predicted O-methyltransferase YrrM
MTLFLKERSKNEELVGVEIGVAKGNNALSLLEELSIRKLFLVDPYMPYLDRGQRVSSKGSSIIAQNKLSSFRQVQFVKKTSKDAVKDVGGPLDFVYIDGNHSCEYVKNDIALYYPLVKAGGVIGGHDYVPYHDAGVFQAVNEFVQERGRLGFYAVFPDWWVVK